MLGNIALLRFVTLLQAVKLSHSHIDKLTTANHESFKLFFLLRQRNIQQAFRFAFKLKHLPKESEVLCIFRIGFCPRLRLRKIARFFRISDKYPITCSSQGFCHGDF